MGIALHNQPQQPPPLHTAVHAQILMGALTRIQTVLQLVSMEVQRQAIMQFMGRNQIQTLQNPQQTPIQPIMIIVQLQHS